MPLQAYPKDIFMSNLPKPQEITLTAEQHISDS